MPVRDWLSSRLLVHLIVLRPVLWAIFGVNIKGRENLSGLGRFILVSNHNSHLDTLLLYAALPVSRILRTHPVAAREYFGRSRPLFALVDFLFRPIWVDRTLHDGGALPAIQNALDRGCSVILFPEGTRGEPGKLQRFHRGIGLILQANPTLPVVAVFLEGPERALPRQTAVPLPLWNHVTIAPPLRPGGDSRDITRTLEGLLQDMGTRARSASQQRPAGPLPYLTVAVLGTDGSGKSTLARRLAEAFSTGGRTCLIGDGLEILEQGRSLPLQPLLADTIRRRIGAQAKQAGSLGRYKVPKMAELLLRDRLLRDAGRWYRPRAVFMDGMPLLNLCAWAILFREEHFTPEVCARILAVLGPQEERVPGHDPVFRLFPELVQLRRLGLDRLRRPDLTIFLDVPPEVCLQRIAARGEARQVHETADHLAKLRRAYLMTVGVLQAELPDRVLILDGGPPIAQVTGEAVGFLTPFLEAPHDD